MADHLVAYQIPHAWNRKQVEAVLGVKKTRLWAGIKSGEFPAPLKLDGMTRWCSSEVIACQAERLAKAKAARDSRKGGRHV